jgi:hypothetical protein
VAAGILVHVGKEDGEMNLADLLLVKVLNDEKHLYICWHIVW